MLWQNRYVSRQNQLSQGRNIVKEISESLNLLMAHVYLRCGRPARTKILIIFKPPLEFQRVREEIRPILLLRTYATLRCNAYNTHTLQEELIPGLEHLHIPIINNVRLVFKHEDVVGVGTTLSGDDLIILCPGVGVLIQNPQGLAMNHVGHATQYKRMIV